MGRCEVGPSSLLAGRIYWKATDEELNERVPEVGGGHQGNGNVGVRLDKPPKVRGREQ